MLLFMLEQNQVGTTTVRSIIKSRFNIGIKKRVIYCTSTKIVPKILGIYNVLSRRLSAMFSAILTKVVTDERQRWRGQQDILDQVVY